MCMGDMEKDARRRLRRNELSTLILRTVAAAGIIATAVVAPNVVGAMYKLNLVPGTRDKELIKRAVDRLYKQGKLKHVGSRLALTESGRDSLRSWELMFTKMSRPRRWDHRWRVLIFDIPESKKKLRDSVRATLRTIGFVRLQQSVWVYPYDCEDWVMLWKAEFKLGSELLYMIVDSIEGDSKLRRLFELTN